MLQIKAYAPDCCEGENKLEALGEKLYRVGGPLQLVRIKPKRICVRPLVINTSTV